MLVPGERVTEEIAEQLLHYRELNFSIQGVADEDQIEVWINGED